METETLVQTIRKRKHTQASLARELNVSPQRVNNWVMRGIPLRWVPKVAAILKVPKSKLCPDWPPF